MRGPLLWGTIGVFVVMRYKLCAQPLQSVPQLARCPAPTPPHPAPPRPARADGLWWLGSGRAVNALRRLLLLASLAVFLLAVEERVIFHSFNQARAACRHGSGGLGMGSPLRV